MTDDRLNINLHTASDKAAEYIKERFGFPQILDVVRLGFAYAMARNINLTPGDWGERGTNYGVASIDGQGLISAMVRLRPEKEATETPFRAIEILMNKGLIDLKASIDAGLISTLSGLIASTRPNNRVDV